MAWHWGYPHQDRIDGTTGWAYSVLADLDLDGDVEADDKTDVLNNHSGATLGWEVLSAEDFDNIVGFTGSKRSAASSSLQFNRHRLLSLRSGRWHSRDALGYIDSMGLYSYVDSNPLSGLDPFGLSAGGGVNCLARLGEVPPPPGHLDRVVCSKCFGGLGCLGHTGSLFLDLDCIDGIKDDWRKQAQDIYDKACDELKDFTGDLDERRPGFAAPEDLAECSEEFDRCAHEAFQTAVNEGLDPHQDADYGTCSIEVEICQAAAARSWSQFVRHGYQEEMGDLRRQFAGAGCRCCKCSDSFALKPKEQRLKLHKAEEGSRTHE